MTPDYILQQVKERPELTAHFQPNSGSPCYITRDGAFVTGEGANRIKTDWGLSGNFGENADLASKARFSTLGAKGLFGMFPEEQDEIFAYRTAPSWATPEQLEHIPRF